MGCRGWHDYSPTTALAPLFLSDGRFRHIFTEKTNSLAEVATVDVEVQFCLAPLLAQTHGVMNKHASHAFDEVCRTTKKTRGAEAPP